MQTTTSYVVHRKTCTHARHANTPISLLAKVEPAEYFKWTFITGYMAYNTGENLSPHVKKRSYHLFYVISSYRISSDVISTEKWDHLRSDEMTDLNAPLAAVRVEPSINWSIHWFRPRVHINRVHSHLPGWRPCSMDEANIWHTSLTGIPVFE